LVLMATTPVWAEILLIAATTAWRFSAVVDVAVVEISPVVTPLITNLPEDAPMAMAVVPPATTVALAVAVTPVLDEIALIAAALAMALLLLALNDAVSLLASESPTNVPLMEKSPALMAVVVNVPRAPVSGTPEAYAVCALKVPARRPEFVMSPAVLLAW